MPSGDRRFDVYLIADYGKNDPAFGEVNAKLRANGGDSIRPADNIAVPKFSTIATGFWIRQMGIENGYPGMVIFSNTAPRGSSEAIRWNGDNRQRLIYGKLKNDVPVFAVSAGFTWSFIRDELVELYDLKIPNEGSQFRSRDYYAPAVARFLAGDISILGEELDKRRIPNVPVDRLAFEDGYGNLKLTTRASEFTSHLRRANFLDVVVEGRRAVAYNHLAGNESPVGRLGLVKGSSGSIQDRYLELVVRGSSAAELFGNPPVSDNAEPIEFSAHRNGSQLR